MRFDGFKNFLGITEDRCWYDFCKTFRWKRGIISRRWLSKISYWFHTKRRAHTLTVVQLYIFNFVSLMFLFWKLWWFLKDSIIQRKVFLLKIVKWSKFCELQFEILTSGDRKCSFQKRKQHIKTESWSYIF